MTVHFENIPQALRDRQQWVLWYLGKPDEAGKRPKVPLVRESDQSLTAFEWSKHSNRWWSFEHAAAILNRKKRCPVPCTLAYG
jgi:primase-polymerase (primpol)-like protein